MKAIFLRALSDVTNNQKMVTLIIVDSAALWITLRVTHIAWTTVSQLPTLSTILLLIFKIENTT
ncbi:MAG: hypothetical protein AMJ42_01340 [Deltaproteobacteria bacterium DG_8]|jgi:hypothetical protein|nr:MAG: hypothetical protein AMJ42_01340 [Deltaproteobacteria bacterium DG_8]